MPDPDKKIVVEGYRLLQRTSGGVSEIVAVFRLADMDEKHERYITFYEDFSDKELLKFNTGLIDNNRLREDEIANDTNGNNIEFHSFSKKVTLDQAIPEGFAKLSLYPENKDGTFSGRLYVGKGDNPAIFKVRFAGKVPSNLAGRKIIGHVQNTQKGTHKTTWQRPKDGSW
jgi:hypothetical protein